MLKTILTHDGSGFHMMRQVCQELGATLHAIDHIRHAQVLHFDGILLLGGCDIHPSLYGQKITHSREANRKRDTIEWYLVRRALTERKPILGLCRGHQMLTVALGGSLYQDVLLERKKTKIAHSGTNHDLLKVRQPLKSFLPTTWVNSYHHQAIRRMPFGMSVMATSRDGLIEAIYRKRYLGVQFHPEYMVERDNRWMSLFKWFVEGRLS